MAAAVGGDFPDMHQNRFHTHKGASATNDTAAKQLSYIHTMGSNETSRKASVAFSNIAGPVSSITKKSHNYSTANPVFVFVFGRHAFFLFLFNETFILGPGHWSGVRSSLHHFRGAGLRRGAPDQAEEPTGGS